MRPHELRIGNWVSHNSEWCHRGENVDEFKWDESDWFALGECILFLENIEPIPLTEERLITLGMDDLGTYGFGIGKFHIRYGKTKNDFYFFIENQFIKIKYVHQLQNLYFALTGEELEIKEE